MRLQLTAAVGVTSHRERGNLMSYAVCMDRQFDWPLRKWRRARSTAAAVYAVLTVETPLPARSIGRRCARTILFVCHEGLSVLCEGKE